MEAAYGLAITLCMIATSILVCQLPGIEQVKSFMDLYLPDRLFHY